MMTDSYGWRFWAIIGALAITSLLSALDISVISTALPTIVHDLGSGGPAFAWVANAYFLTSTAFQPLFGQTANIFGRRILTIISVFLFALGSAVSGSASSMGVLIFGRAIQGVGGGGVNVMIQIVVGDLVPLRDRSKFMGIIFSTFTIALSIGPVVGGALAEYASWRWIFYLNLPIAGLALVLLSLYLRLEHQKDSASNMLRRIDFAGNAILIPSVIAVLLALTWAGTEESWSSWRTILPLVLGVIGLIGFLALESTDLIREPTVPIRSFSNRTSLPTFALAFIHSILTYWLSYYLPVYFQAVLEATPTQSGINLLPSAVVSMVFAIAAGIGLSALNRFKPFMFASFSLLAISYGALTRLDQNSTTAYWVGWQIVAAAGIGTLMTVTLPAIQAPLDESDQATTSATWSFVRSFGGIWGVAIPTAIFNSQVNNLLDRVSDAATRDALQNGGAYSLATKDFMQSLNSQTTLKSEVLSVYIDSLKLVWQVAIGFGLLGFLVTFIVKGIPLREDLKTNFGIEKDENSLHSPPGTAESQVIMIKDIVETKSEVVETAERR
ncbi:hypothetical protein N0V93_008918 [Gnomoniopsis smithogilvyi]|uniref:Major facilitator superfamily (MFS) profile domain-containing protein n=1 Tax=Gnomoniopsis smithogilvyi TaxID=1191159 RepID=A0A9W8YIZ8_9PEZI|nr:hypothetical protein N0V93_008918 [Gnomoniopsis smithogilvyi]